MHVTYPEQLIKLTLCDAYKLPHNTKVSCVSFSEKEKTGRHSSDIIVKNISKQHVNHFLVLYYSFGESFVVYM